MSQWCPAGSASRPCRIPYGWSAIGKTTFAPAATARSATASGSSTTRLMRTLVPPRVVGLRLKAGGVLVNGVEALTVDRHLDDELSARTRLARDLGRSECLPVELDGCARVLDGEEGRQRHARHISTPPLSWTLGTRRAAVANSPFAQHTATSASPQ